jgi:ureidoglycolate lyase
VYPSGPESDIIAVRDRAMELLVIRALPLEASAYAPYGAIIGAGEEARARSANHGTALAWDALATIENRRGASARAIASLFRCRAHRQARLPVRFLERHPDSTQMFVPMRARRYLVIVAQGGDVPDLGTVSAFVVSGAQAITYAPGTWHHPMVALDEDADFVNVIFSDGTDRDCEERSFDPPRIEIEIPGLAE